MSQTINNKPVIPWIIDARFRVNELAELSGTIYRNVTGVNTDPSLNDGNWSTDVGTGGSGGSGTTIKEPQKFNPSAGDVTAGFTVVNLSSNNSVAFVTVNGQTLNSDEYSLAADVLTVTPDNGFVGITSEVLVFQHSFSSLELGIKGNYVSKSANYTILESDYIIECTANSFDLTLADESTVGAGAAFIIKNTGDGIVTLLGVIDGVTNMTISKPVSLTIVSNGVSYIIV